MKVNRLQASLLLTVVLTGLASAQTLYFPTNVPSNWSAASGSLAISTSHYKTPGAPLQCLQWNYGANDILTVTNPGISNVYNYSKNTCDLWVYNPAPLPNQKLTFQFSNTSGTVQSFDFYLNYSGWRQAIRSYRYDMSGPVGNWSFNAVKIFGPTNHSGQLFFDVVTWVDANSTRSQDLQNLDVAGPNSTTRYYHAYFETPPDIPTNLPTASELSDLAAIRAAWLADNAGSAPSGSSVQSAYASWTNLDLVINGSDIKGEVINDNVTADNYYAWLLTIAKDVYWNNTSESISKMNLFLRNWWDQGMDYNSGNATAGSSPGYSFRTVPSAFVLGYPGYDAATRQHVWQMLHWMYRMGHYWSTNWTPGLTAAGADDYTLTDDVYLDTRRELGAILFLTPDDATAIQYLKGYRRYIERFLIAVNGTDDGLKIDGCGFHHNGHYNHYMYAFNELTDVLYDLKGTQFQVNSNAYRNLRGALLAMIRMSNSGVSSSQVGYNANSLSGRSPFQNSDVVTSYTTLRHLGVLGGDILGGQAADPMVAQIYNRIFGASYPYSTFTSYGVEPNPEGFYQFNYSPIGLLRQSNWVACMHGMNSDFWGTEIAINANVYGRYQSYGALEVLYPGGPAASGWGTSGWNWNQPPGATTIVLPWSQLIYDSATSSYMERDTSALNFAGALAFHSGGNDIQNGIYGGFGGLYACNFQETGGANHNPSFVWRKSFFCFSNQIISLGSNIADNDAANPTVTTLFQSQLASTSTAVMLNGSSLTAFPYSLTNNDTTAVWLLDPQGTGYFVRPGSPLRLDRKAQISPNQSGNGAFSTNNYATAWIDHGTAPTGTGYEYVVIPGTTSTAMSQLAADYINPSTTPYKVLERDSTAHVVQWKPDGRIGYALFRTGALSAAVTNAGPLRSVSLPCLVMTQPTNSSLWLTVVNPDLNLINNVSTPTNVDVTVAGNWNSLSGSTNASILSVNGTATVVRVRTVNGLPVEVLLDFAGPVTPTLTAPVASAIFDGQTLAASTLTGGTATIAISGTAVAGSFAFTTPDILPNVGTTNVSVTFTPLDTNNFATATTNVTVTVLSPVAGATFQWDPDLANPGAQDGSGTWSVASANWLYGTNHVGWADHNVASFGVATTTNCTVTLANDVTPAGINFAPTAGTYTIAGTNAIRTTDNPNLIVSNNAAISAPITGSGGLNNTVWGTLTISGTNSYAGGTTVTRGTINIFGDQSAAAGGWTLSSSLIGVGMTVNFNAGSAIIVSSGNSIVLHNYMNSGLLDAALNVAGTVINNGMLDDNRRGNLTLNSGATWTQNGGMFIRTTSNTSQGSSLTVSDGATFTYAGIGPIGISPANINSGSALLAIAGGTFITSQGFQNATATSTGTATILLKNGGTLKLSANIAQLMTGSATNTFISTGTGGAGGAIDTAGYSTTVSNVLTGTGSLTKLGAGTLTLTASNTFAGSLSISNGTVAVNGSLGSGTVAVAPAGTLGGTGVVGAVTVSGSIAPGNGAVGSLTTAGETWNGGGAYQFGLNSATNSSGWDLLKIGGALNLQSATNNRFTIRLISLTSSNTPGPLADFASTGTNVWTLATASGGIQNFDPAKFAVDTTGFSNAFTGTFSVSTNASALLLTYAGVPLTAPLLDVPALIGKATVGFSFSGPEGQSYHVYSSTNLILPLANWQTETSGIFGAGPVIYSEGTADNPRKFFRVGSP